MLKRTEWYKRLFVDPEHERFPDNLWYRKHHERNFDLVNLGSSAARWAFDYEGLNVKAMNWACQPQTLTDDFRILKNFHSILRHKGHVLITIMPFTSLNKEVGMMDTFKYQGTLDRSLLDPRYTRKAALYRRFPVLFGRAALKGLIRSLLKREPAAFVQPLCQSMSSAQLDADALRWIDGWKKQFRISDFDAPLSEENRKGRAFRVSLLREMLDFCTERELVPVYVIPPVTKHLSAYFTDEFQERYIYGFLEEVGRDVRLLDYSRDEVLTDDRYYFNSFFLNREGAGKFTVQLLKDLGLPAI